MNVISIPVRRPSGWHDEHSVHNLLGNAHKKSSRSVIDEEDEVDLAQQRKKYTNRYKKNAEKRERAQNLLGKLRHIVTSRKYREVDWCRITIDVGGKKFSVYRGTLRTVPGTRLANLNEDCVEFDRMYNEYFFDRNPEIFPYILDFYRYGEMHVPRFICAKKLKDEMKYWGLNGSCLALCCKKYYYDSLDEIFAYEGLQANFESVPDKLYGVESNSSLQSENIREKLWSFLDNPKSSLAAKIWSRVYMLLVVLSIVCMFTGTLPSCRDTPNDSIFHIRMPEDLARNSKYVVMPPKHNVTMDPCLDPCDALPSANLKVLSFLSTQPHDALLGIDLFCVIFFTLEILARFVVCPRRLRMLLCFATFSDIVYIIPTLCMFLIDFTDRSFWREDNMTVWFLILNLLMIFRILRLFRFMRYHHGLKSLWLAIRASTGELLLLFTFMLLAATMFATFIFCAEFFESSNYYENIYIGMWWALITMTTVGYGDFYPQTTAGYIVASFCALTGITLMGMPVPIIAGNFQSFYGLQFYNFREQHIQHVKQSELNLPGDDCNEDKNSDTNSAKSEDEDVDINEEEHNETDDEDKDENLCEVIKTNQRIIFKSNRILPTIQLTSGPSNATEYLDSKATYRPKSL